MSRWWRAYDDAVDNAKLILLTDRQHRTWFNLCCVNSANGGTLPALAVIAVKLRMAPEKARRAVAELAALGLVDDIGGGKMAMHNWDRRQFKTDVTDPTNAERQKRYRNRHRITENTVTETVTGKLPETEAETDKRDVDRARARPLIRLGAHTLSDDCLHAIGINPHDPPPEWAGLPHQTEMMLERGFNPQIVVATFAEVGGRKPLKPMRYFMKAVETAHVERAAQEQGNAKPGNVIAAADRQLDRLTAYLGSGSAPRAIRDGEGSAPIRLLPEGPSE
jgi:hypothetical protein